MTYFAKLYLVALAAFLAIDFLWLAVVARKFYRTRLGFLLAEQPNWWPAVAFYLIFVAGIVTFCIHPALQSESLYKALLRGGFFGLVTYATYDLTNHATVKDWPWVVTLVDLCWGLVLSASVSTVGYLAARWFGSS